jgi:hypothetical protein
VTNGKPAERRERQLKNTAAESHCLFAAGGEKKASKKSQSVRGEGKEEEGNYR